MVENSATGGVRQDNDSLVARLLEAGSEDAVTLTGYVGPGSREGYVRLFPGLTDMSKSIEIAQSDIVESVELPKSGLGAIALWVRRDAELHHHVVERAESYAARTTGRALEPARRGELRMMVRSHVRDVCTCEIYCDGTGCMPCTSNCLARAQ
ncbi:hypothetical protein ABNF97_16220 [Plantactinospora sp. B6F1]|uniref:hypothetical protein n=1 Tax=Plantactinospora sp. B6F1 TaxID=3158971 RepID=UPI00102BFBEC